MTYEEALINQDISNTALGDNTSIVYFGIFAMWQYNYIKVYNLVLYPTKYEAKFNTADYSDAIAFARVSAKTQFDLSSGSSYDQFVTSFDENAVNDTELNNYLNKP
jgi:hypothetical protein